MSLDCIALCVEHIGANDIIWHDMRCITETEVRDVVKYQTFNEHFKLTKQEREKQIFTPLELWKNYNSFSWVWMGIFKASLIQNLRFCPQIQSEDGLFGMLLFAKAANIKILAKPLYVYRFRAHSISQHGEIYEINKYPYYMKDIVSSFNNGYKVKHYHFAYSCTYICLGLLDFITTLPKQCTQEQAQLKDKLVAFLQTRAIYAFGGVTFEYDPKSIRSLLKPLEPYMQKVSLRVKIAYFMPSFYRFLRKGKEMIKRMRA